MLGENSYRLYQTFHQAGSEPFPVGLTLGCALPPAPKVLSLHILSGTITPGIYMTVVVAVQVVLSLLLLSPGCFGKISTRFNYTTQTHGRQLASFVPENNQLFLAD